MDIKTVMKNDMVAKLAILLCESNIATSEQDALCIVLNSETYQRLMDDKSGLFYQSPRYVFDFLIKELRYGKVR